MATDNGYSFEQVFEHECAHIARLSGEARPESGAFAPDQLMGLALSGGGIRSATFNLGVLQAISQLKLLNEFDYLSTVSGGGYIGSWLSAWIRRADEANRAREREHKTASEVPHTPGVRTVQDQLSLNEIRREPAQLSFLRNYSNYLTPKAGLFSTDTLAGVATYLRNFILNVAILFSCLIAVLLMPRVVTWVGMGFERWAIVPLVVGLAGLACATFLIELNLASQLPQSERIAPWYSKRAAILQLIVAPLAVAGLCLSYWLVGTGNDLSAMGIGWFVSALICSTLIVAFFWTAALVIARVKRSPGDRPTWGWRLLGLAVGLAVGLVALVGLQRIFLASGLDLKDGIWHATVWGLPALLGVFFLTTLFIIGTSGRQFEEDSREWWSRLGGILFAVAVGWLLLAAAAIYAPWGVMKLPGLVQGLSVAWLATTLAGVRAGNSAATGSSDSKRWLNRLVSFTPYIFVAGLLVALAWGIHVLLAATTGDEDALSISSMGAWQDYARQITEWLSGRQQWVLLGSVVAIAAFLSWRIDVNVFSFHMFYRNRLIRCYLGASNPSRKPHSFTGFDRNDSPTFAELVQRPYHLINTALNLTKGKKLAWQERKAAAFVLSPLYCGYDMEDADGVALRCYQPTNRYVARAKGCLGLGTALAISGAAASPNQGYHSSPAVAFLMTVFNVRLGWWMQNPSDARIWEREGPRWGFWYLLSELLGATDEQSRFVYLSDGGHFDNLGLYELVRRRCHFIVACDAGCDPGFKFQDLGNAIRKCKVDLGVSIDIDTRAILPAAAGGKSLFHCALGTIHYERLGAEAAEGYLLYIKPSLTGSEPLDVLQYAKAHPAFPHESTADQWFAESQFESYRTLGWHVARTVFEGANVSPSDGRESMFVALKERWYPGSAAIKESFSRHADQLKVLQAQLQADTNLRFLDSQIYPEWDRLMDGRTEVYPSNLSLPTRAAEVRAGFYLCGNLLGLMESIYLDLNLEDEYGHPDNRGWMNLFKHWSWSTMFMATYAIRCATHGGRFQRFCERRLGLSSGDVTIEEKQVPAGLDAFLAAEERAGRLNFVENGLIRRWTAEGARFNQVVLLRLRVADPSTTEQGGAAVSVLEFTFGFALAQDRELVYFRVQDHLRRMGLAREGLKQLAKRGHTKISSGARSDSPETLRRFRLLLNSVLRELPDLPRGQ